MDPDEEESVYANDETRDLINVGELLKTHSLEELLKENKKEVKEKEIQNEWFHGRIARDAAEEILKKGLVKFGNIDGLFLVRESSYSSSSFVLSLVSKGIFYHFQINEIKSSHFSIDDGPVVHGLDRLIQNYLENAQGLPAQLTQFCKCRTPPEEHRLHGITNILHRAVLENVHDIVKQILDSKHCPPIDAKNEWGYTALHDACYYGFEAIADELCRRNAKVGGFDRDGKTPLHRCCANNKAGIIAILIQEGKANINERNPKTGWIPLHEAAFNGNLDCIKILLDYHSPYLPRADDGRTPLDLALTYEYADCVSELENFEPPKINSPKKDWFHPEVDRVGAQQLLELKGLREGLFITRNSKKNQNWHVLTLCHQQKVYNYEIKTENYHEWLVYYIDDGPYFRSIEHLVQYYSYSANGLPCALTVAISPTRELKLIKEEDEYFNLSDTQRTSIAPTPTPELPPRPVSLEDVSYSDLDQHKSDINSAKVPSSPKHQVTPPPLPNHPPPRQLSVTKPAPQVPPPEPPPPVIELKRIEKKHLKLGPEIGQGEFGSVVKGVYKRHIGRKVEKVDVAIKKFHRDNINNQEDFLKEARTMQQLHHECIVNFLGISEWDNHELLLVEEYIEMGSMLDYLIDHADEICVKTDLYLWAAQIAYGMMYLEQQKMVHRDLAARNILLQNKKRAKISDFGLSRAVGSSSDYYKATTGGRWPIKWYAPECVNFGHFSHASDVWSFGVTLWEMFSFGEPPYGEMKGIQVIKYIEEGKRLEQPEKCPDLVYKEMCKCWTKEPKQRPTFKDLNIHFESNQEYASTAEMMKQLKKNKKTLVF